MCIFALALTFSSILKLKKFHLQKLGQGQKVKFLQLHHLMANVEIYK